MKNEVEKYIMDFGGDTLGERLNKLKPSLTRVSNDEEFSPEHRRRCKEILASQTLEELSDRLIDFHSGWQKQQTL